MPEINEKDWDRHTLFLRETTRAYYDLSYDRIMDDQIQKAVVYAELAIHIAKKARKRDRQKALRMKKRQILKWLYS